MLDHFDSKEQFRLTTYLRQKLKEQRSNVPIVAPTAQQEQREIGKRNALIKKSYELEKKGLTINASFFEQEARLMKCLRLSKFEPYNNLRNELLKKSTKFDKPPQMSLDLVLGRVYKFILIKSEKLEMDKRFGKDYFDFSSMVQSRLDPQKIEEIKNICHQIQINEELILKSEQNLEFLERNGYKYNESTFDDLYIHGFNENLTNFNISTDSSDDMEEIKQPEVQKEVKKRPIVQEIPTIDQVQNQHQLIERKVEEKKIIQKDLFDVEDEYKSNENEEEKKAENFFIQEDQEEEDLLDINSIDPTKVNWFKLIVDNYLKLEDEDGNPSALNNPDAYANLLTILMTTKKDEEIQGELLDLVGYHNFEFLEQLISKREYIKEHCKVLNEKLQFDKQQNQSYRPKNMTGHAAVGVSMEYRDKKGKKNKKIAQSYMENDKITTYDLLKKLGFDKDFIEERKRQGMRELTKDNIKWNNYLLSQKEERKQVQAQIFEKNDAFKDYKQVTEENDEWRFVEITPPPKQQTSKNDLIALANIPEFARKAFGSTTHLNTIQSKVFEVAFKTSKNLLVAAPTGSGKTNIALMTVLREVSHHIDMEKSKKIDMTLKQFKIIYIAPLKALASEIVAKFSAALGYLGIKVKELTGDMNMSKQEIQETHIIVSTPEKWDVVTRKTDGMMDLVNVLILDEIHLLNDERGLVLECLVSRAQMTGMKLQKPIRVVGLSATLPNYEDVARFIAADDKGTFAFDASYRPTPLKCGFYGVKDLGNTQRANNIMNQMIYKNIRRCLKMGKQVIIFVHRRAETFSTATELIEILKSKPNDFYLFDCEYSYKVKPEVTKGRNEQIKRLFDFGFSVHHAGLLRKDRNLVESMFLNGHIKVLCCTATLAWGVNLPAYCVVIKGTKMYDSSSGEYKEIGIFDVQQIFGRAGRPQFDNEGEAIIFTQHKQMDEYVKMMQNKQTIESNLLNGLSNCINAEIACGNITTVTEGAQWLKKSYFYQRVIKNPLHYGIRPIDIQLDPQADQVLLEKVNDTIMVLNRMMLIRFNEQTSNVFATDMGRIASNYYINVETMSYFMENLKPNIREQIFLYHLASATEFKQLEARKEEYDELKLLANDVKYVEIDKNSYTEAATKVQIILEAYLRQKQLKTFSLISDMAYIVQNSARLLRALFEIALNKNYANLCKMALRWCHILDKRLRPDDHPMKQFCADSHLGKLTNPNQNVSRFGYLKEDIVMQLQFHNYSMEKLYSHDIPPIGNYNEDELKKFLNFLPKLELEITCQPITRAILKVHLSIKPNFQWNDRWNGKSEPFWIIVDNDSEILHSEFFQLHKKDVQRAKQKKSSFKNENDFSLTFFVPYEVEQGEKRIEIGSHYNLSLVSDRWYDISFYEEIDLSELQVPEEDYPHTILQKLQPISIKALNNENYESLYKDKFKFFNPIQTQIFHALFHTDSNILIGAPTGSGKTIMAEIAMLRAFKLYSDQKVIYIAPLKALAKERIIDWKKRLQNGSVKKIVEELTGDVTPDIKALQKADILITTPEKWDGISRNWQHRSYVQKVALVVIDEIHLLGQERGPVIEVIVSRMRYISEQTGNKVRFVGLSTALANAKDVADWLGIHKLGLYNFKPSVRPVPIKVFFEGFSEKHYCPRMGTMNKPAYRAIMTHSKDNPVLIFVSSRRQTRLTAMDLIAMCAAEQQDYGGDQALFKRPLLKMNHEEIHVVSTLISDESLKHTIQFGVGMHHAGLTESDRKIVEKLFVEKKIQVLVTTSTLAWGVNFPARLVIVKGTEFFDPKSKRYVDFPLTDLLQMIGRAGRPQYDETGYACVFVSEEKKNFYKKFLYEPFPVESSLADKIVDHINAEIASGTLLTKQNCIDYLTWTYFFRRLTKNPAFYNLKIDQNRPAEGINQYLKQLVNDTLQKLQAAGCVKLSVEDESVSPTAIGYLASFYYLSYETIQYIKQNLTASMKIYDLIPILANVKEFYGLPVRHNEDNLNEALTHLVPIKVSKHDLENPHVKANLLLQAHFERCPMPIADYITDTKSVLDQSIRIIQGMIDISAHQGFCQTTLYLINLLQMIIQGQWMDQSPLINVPHFNSQIIKKLAAIKINTLRELIERSKGDIKRLFNFELKLQIPYDDIKEIYQALDKVPLVEVKYSVVAVNEKNEILDRENLNEGGEGMIIVNLNRTNKANKQKVLISRFPKVKEAAWFIVITNPHTNDVLALKRVSFNRYATKKVVVALPNDFLEEKLNLYVMCDSYIGLDQRYQIDLIQINGIISGKKQASKQEQISVNVEDSVFSSYKDINQRIIDDIFSDDEEQKPAIHKQIERQIDNLLDSDEEESQLKRQDRIEEDLVDEEEDEENDYEQIIEKDLDNWI